MRIENIKKLINNAADVILLDKTDSTNNFAMSRSFENDAIVIAKAQTNGKGRNSKSFISPEGGLYMSIVLTENKTNHAGFFTAAAAVAVVRAIRKVFNIESKIKWVNDIYYNGKKVCGILCESEIENINVKENEKLPRAGEKSMFHQTTSDERVPMGTKMKKVVIGIGVNLSSSELLPAVAGALVQKCSEPDAEFLCAAVYNNFLDLITAGGFFNEYKNNCDTIGKNIIVKAKTEFSGVAVGIAPDFSLLVESGGELITVNFGEVSIKNQ